VSRRARIRSADLALTNAVAAAALLASLVTPGGWLQASVLTLFVLAATGYAVTAALFPPRAIEAEDRYIYSFVLSISGAALTGLLLQVFVRLDREAWITLLVLIVLAASAVAQWRRTRLPIQRSAGRAMQLPAGPLWALGFLVALAIAGASIGVAVSGVHEQQGRQRFASLWALPVAGGIEAGVWNHGARSAFRLDLSSDGQTLVSRRLHLSPGERWSSRFAAASPGAPTLVLTLYQGALPYRTVELNNEQR
jgi:hypothetical protein